MSLHGGNTNWDYLRILVGSKFRTGMMWHDLLYILAGSPKMVSADYNDPELFRLWAVRVTGNKEVHPGYTAWDWLRILAQYYGVFTIGDIDNDMLRKLAAKYPNGAP